MRYLSTFGSFLFLSFISLTSIFADKGGMIQSGEMGKGMRYGFMMGRYFTLRRIDNLLILILLIVIVVLLVKILRKK